MEIKSLEHTNIDAICGAFGRAFAEYEVQLDAAQMMTMWKRRGFDPAMSFAAFDRGEIVAFTLNGIGLYDGVPTAYDTGTGTLKEYRGQGLATEIFEYSIPFLKGAGIGQYLLEVLQHNTKAVSVYRNLGFTTSREFNYFTQQNKGVRIARGADPRYAVGRIDVMECGPVAGFWDFTPSWQNSMEAIRRAPGDFVGLGAFESGRLAGYAVFEPASGDITQLAVDPRDRRRGVASLLLRSIMGLNCNPGVKVINTDAGCSSITEFLAAANIPLKGKQFEMIRKL